MNQPAKIETKETVENFPFLSLERISEIWLKLEAKPNRSASEERLYAAASEAIACGITIVQVTVGEAE